MESTVYYIADFLIFVNTLDDLENKR